MGVFIGLGSNVGAGPARIWSALDRLARQANLRVTRVSSLYRTAPWGGIDQADFTNAVAEIETGLRPGALLDVLLDTESALGRVRDGERWGPRNIDLDLLCFDDLIVTTARLTIPHPRMARRAFVLVPLLELESDFVIPGLGSARDCLSALEPQSVKRLA